MANPVKRTVCRVAHVAPRVTCGVSGQRRRRYRDERYPTQSPMPLTVACASPEMASGKVWIRYPVVRPQDQQPEEVQVQDASVAKTCRGRSGPGLPSLKPLPLRRSPSSRLPWNQ
ncbi:ribonuclease, Rne/Rng family [Klebsiella pneumoniae]|uniref:Ribonuclease, Rne/Rng family n=1 Tax=Klebsiella pneumoniae TaxID=573 RepID=A0A3S4IXV2_KLEPN|nr:ribonuclease, Rne/Rng family [Klebsiella pneumoniae]